LGQTIQLPEAKIEQMITGETFIEMALSFPGTEQKPHFERIGFKVVETNVRHHLSENNSANILILRKNKLSL
jgi:hypothetical protein